MRRFTMRMNVLCAALLFVAACGDDDPAPAATPTADVVESDATGDATGGDAVATDTTSADTAAGDTAAGDTAATDTVTEDTSADAGMADAGMTEDAGMADAGMADAGMTEDAGMADAGMTEDAGMADAGMTDAGMTEDAGMGDAGMGDAGMAEDTGPVDETPTWDGHIQAIIAANCGTCHGNSGGWGANSYADSQKAAYSSQCSGMTKGECYSVRIKDETMPTNKSVLADMTASGDLELLDQWIAGGMPEN